MFCTNCGKQFPDGAKFCPECGANVGQSISESYRKQVYAGEVKKCPSCGMELPSMVAICPGCGHELNSQHVNPVIAQFSGKISECDQEIAIEESSFGNKSPQSGWASWSTLKKVGWVLLNFYTFAIPLVLYQIGRVRKNRPQMPAAAKKAAVIENFQIPNEKEAILEFVYFVQTKVNALLAQRADPDTLYWLNLWTIKAKYTHDKAKILLPDNQSVSDIYNDIVAKVNKFKRHVYLKKVGPSVLVSILCLIYILINFVIPILSA